MGDYAMLGNVGVSNRARSTASKFAVLGTSYSASRNMHLSAFHIPPSIIVKYRQSCLDTIHWFNRL